MADETYFPSVMAELDGRPLPWTCTACDTPCELVLKNEIVKFRSACCQAPVRRTKDADSP